MAPLCEQITRFFGSTPAANMAKSYNLNPLWTMITAMFQEQSTTYYILKPIIRRCFPQNLCHFVHFGAISLIHSALEINEKGFGAFSVQSCEGFLFPCYLISHFFLSFLIFFNNYSGWIFIKINNFTTDEKKGIFTRCETTIHRSQAFATSIQDASRGRDSHVPRLSTKKLIRCGKNSIFPDSESQIWNLGNCVEHIGKFAQIITTNPQKKKKQPVMPVKN